MPPSCFLLEHVPACLLEFSPVIELMPDEVLYRRGEEATCVYLVEEGRLLTFSVDASGRSVPLYLVRSGEIAAEDSLFTETYCGEARTEIRSRVRCFPKHQILEALRRNPEFSCQLMTGLARRLTSLRVRLEIRSLKSARERVLQYVISSPPISRDQILIERPLKSIADDVGLTPECFYRALAQLASEGVLTRTKHHFTLHHH